MIAVHDVVTGTEKEESTSAICALRFTLCETFVANKRALLVADKAADFDALQCARGYFAVHLACGGKTGKDRFFEAEEFKKPGIPFERANVEEESA